MSKLGEYYDFVSEIALRHMNDELEKELTQEDKMKDVMIRASNKARLTRNQLFNTLFEEGLLAVYNLGMKHMYEYLEKQIMASWEDRFVRILETDEWVVDYDKEKRKYRISYFEDFHFVDEVWFDAYEEKEAEVTEQNDMLIKPEELSKFIAKFR